MREITPPGRYLGQITSGNGWAPKIGSAQIGTWKKFQNYETTGKDSICSKQLKLSSTHVQNWKVNKSLQQKRCGKRYHVYPPEIMHTNSLGRLRKNHWNTMNACM